ncbi:hypothetical protein [Luteolibacter soli]|uniref:Uncharacterized protein n=1 Tax=Luteolibacter soli TaxID=3135280 RepID=A0ABU9B322_9BACT
MKTFLPAILLLAFAVPAGAEPEAKPAAEPENVDAARMNAASTVKNLKQLYLSLIDFDTDYGAFPNDETAQDVTDATGTTLTFKGGSSNAYLRQLLAMGVKTEKIFQIGGAKAPDDDFKDDSKALAKGECGIAYVTGLTTSNDPSIPLAFAPLVPGKLEFDPGPLGGKAVILRIDGSLKIETITAKGEVVTADGKSILDPAQPYWNGKKPKVALPE